MYDFLEKRARRRSGGYGNRQVVKSNWREELMQPTAHVLDDLTQSPANGAAHLFGAQDAVWEMPGEAHRAFLHIPPNSVSCGLGIIDSLRDPILVLDLALLVQGANQAFYQHFLAVKSDTEGKVIFDLANGCFDHPKVRDLLGSVHSGEKSFHEVEVIQDIPPLGERVMLLNARRVQGDYADPNMIVVVLHDLTGQRQTGESLRIAYEAIKLQVAELRRSNQELEHFAQLASHDLRTPLLTVRQYAKILERRFGNVVGEEQSPCFEYIAQAVDRMTALINDLLAYAQVSQRPDQSPALTDCQTVLKDALANLQASITETEAVVTYESLPVVHVHPTQLLQVLQNLIGNAIQYRNGAAPRILISATKREDRWVFAVRDNGLGIKLEYCERIFEPFRRLHGSDRPGSGLGLAVCKKIVEHYGGRIWVESEPDKGSTFLFTLRA